eukprot:TRINITY_DN66415_c3_g3_i1.p1 TRINITY_DN66415_c3_g3~~TRINITY_DN66415_c3_g3_i1.p1  ORF type:complete len:1005 (+),score=605.70 TRINITY_DN66415_c3_g3_i1:224-3238(+)
MAEQKAYIANAAKVSFGVVRGAAAPASAAVIPALQAAGVGLSSLFDVIKFEIFRDFYQILSLFFSGLAESLPGGFRSFWGKVTNLFAICFSCLAEDFDSEVTIGFFVVKWLLAVVLSSRFIHNYRVNEGEDVRQGLEVSKWGSKSARDFKIAKFSALVLTTLYLPVARDCMQVFSCDIKYATSDSDCYAGGHAFLVFMSLVSVGVFLIPIPILFYKLIQKYKPRERLYDSEGKLQQGENAYTDADYKMDLDKDHSPYKYLYDAYERKWAFYKVLVMCFKLALIMPTTLLVTSNKIGGRDPTAQRDEDSPLLLIQSIITLGVLGLYAGAAWSSRPYLNDSDDWLDGFSRFGALFTALIALLTWFASANTLFSILLNLVTALTTLAMVTLFISNMGPVRNAIKGMRQKIEFTRSRTNPNDYLLFSADLDLHRERKIRIWHEFWDVLIRQDEALRIPHDNERHPLKGDPEKDKYVPRFLDFQLGNTPAYLLDFQGTVGERHEENKEIASRESVQSYEKALEVATKMATDPEYAGLRGVQHAIMRNLNGLDVYWEGEVEDKPEGGAGQQKQRKRRANTSSTKFGKLYIVPFPFTAVIFMDDTKQYNVFSYAPIVSGVVRDSQAGMKEFFALVKQNDNPEIVRRKQVRWSLRALSGNMVDFYYQCHKNKTKHRTKTDSQGRQVRESYTVRVLFTFRKGMFRVGQDTKKTEWVDEKTGRKVDLSRGFNCTIFYRDGEGVDHEGKHWKNEHHTIGHGELGINAQFQQTANLTKLLGGNQPIVNAKYPEVMATFQRYREYYFHEFQRKEKVLTYSFWYYVYNNDLLTMEDLRDVLNKYEPNPVVKELPEKHAQALERVYSVLKYYDSSSAIAFWFCFWHDAWIHNQEMKIMQENKDLFDPYNESSLMYKPIPELQLKEELNKRGLSKPVASGGFFNGFFNDALISDLYAKMDSLSTERCAVELAFEMRSELIKEATAVYGHSADFFQTKEELDGAGKPSEPPEVEYDEKKDD